MSLDEDLASLIVDAEAVVDVSAGDAESGVGVIRFQGGNNGAELEWR